MLSEPSFWAASTNENVAKFTYGELFDLDKHTIIYRIKVPKGARVGFGQAEQSEFVFKNNSKFRVSNIDHSIKESQDVQITTVDLLYRP